MDIERQNCRDRILSNNYLDILVDFDITPEILFQGSVENPDYCEQRLSENLKILHVAASEVPSQNSIGLGYQYIPKCYGLLQDTGVPDLTALAEAGILAVSGPPLELTGRNVIMGIIDTGERVIIMSS